jgi:fructosamine-3-kinase
MRSRKSAASHPRSSPRDHDRASVDIPAAAGDLTPAFLGAALGTTGPSAPGAAFSIEPVGVGYGFTSESFRCSWVEGATGHSVVVKMWDPRGAGGSREPTILEQFGRRIGIRVAQSLFSALDEASGRAVLVLEDLGAVTQGDALRTLGRAGGLAVAGVLAALHATWWDSPALTATDWLPALDPLDRGSTWFEDRRRTFIKRFAARVEAPELAALERAELLARRADALFVGAPQTLLHADLHLDNVVFAGGEPILLDWARAARGPAEVDVAELLFGVVEAEHRAAVLNHYLVDLARRGVAPDAVGVDRRLAAGAVRHFLRGTLGVSAWQPRTDRQRRLVEVGIERAKAALAWLQVTHPDVLAG